MRLRLAAAVAGVFFLSSTTSAQEISIGADQPCTAAFGPLGYPQPSRFVPPDANLAARSRIRGVVAKSLTWSPGETVKVCFRSGTQKARTRVAQMAREWMQHANLVLDFGDVNDPQTCKGDNHEAIKIDFVNSGPKAGFWSTIGTVSRKAEHSLNLSFLGEDELPRDKAGKQMPEAEARRVVLHEFGHALGLFHEHQSPKGGCAAEYYEEAVLAYGALRGWPREQTIRNFQQLTDTPELNASEVDRKSIMHYALPPWLFKGGDKSPCAVKPNIELSDGDKAFMQRLYPKATEPQVVASGPATSTTRSAKGTAARATQAKLVEEYRRSLQEAGLEQSKVDSLSKAFSASLSAK